MTTTYRLFWIAADKQSSIDGGQFATLAEAGAAINEFRAQLIEQCADDEEQAGINDGSFSIDEVAEE